MKKSALLILVSAALCLGASCGEKAQEEESFPEITETTAGTVATTGAETETATTKKTTEEAAESTAEEKTLSSSTSVAEKTTTATTSTVGENFGQVDGGGIVFNEPIEEQDDSTLISAATELFRLACETEWNFNVGSPYELDMSQTAQNMYGWDSYLIITEGVNSLADVRADYHKVFSENYPDKLNEVFTESGGRVYCLNGARGSDIFYSGTEIISVDSRSENEITFTAESSYDGDDFGNEPYKECDDFIISVDSDGAWRVSVFRMPY